MAYLLRTGSGRLWNDDDKHCYRVLAVNTMPRNLYGIGLRVSVHRGDRAVGVDVQKETLDGYGARAEWWEYR
jgi:hypothetical protein